MGRSLWRPRHDKDSCIPSIPWATRARRGTYSASPRWRGKGNLLHQHPVGHHVAAGRRIARPNNGPRRALRSVQPSKIQKPRPRAANQERRPCSSLGVDTTPVPGYPCRKRAAEEGRATIKQPTEKPKCDDGSGRFQPGSCADVGG